jgi:UDP-N-acetylmuramate dehydrogenase
VNKRQKETLIRKTNHMVCFDCPMSRYTTMRVGGKAEALYMAEDLHTLRELIRFLSAEQIPYITIGKGSNILVQDKGLDGLVILLGGALADIKMERQNHPCNETSTVDPVVFAGGGLSIAGFLSYCTTHAIGGGEFLAGIPGTIGGAAAMNAGAQGREIESIVKNIEVMDTHGNIVVKERPELDFGYRELSLEKGAMILKVGLNLHTEAKEIVRTRIRENQLTRKESQPLEYASAGSVFKNPPGDYAARLIDEIGLKGKQIGGAMISQKHANFIVNVGGARTDDILALMDLARREVKRQKGIELETEIRVIGRG